MVLGEHRVLLFLGRTHLYEGHGPAAVAHPIRTAAAAGVRLAVLTNANGSLRDDVEARAAGADPRPPQPGDAAVPLEGPRFVDLTDAWSPRLRAIAQRLDPDLARVCTRCSAGPTTRPGPRPAGCAGSAPTWSACRRCTRRSRRESGTWSCSGSRPSRRSRATDAGSTRRRGADRRTQRREGRATPGPAGRGGFADMSTDIATQQDSPETPARRRGAIETNGINVIDESERKGSSAGLFWPWCASNISVLAVSLRLVRARLRHQPDPGTGRHRGRRRRQLLPRRPGLHRRQARLGADAGAQPRGVRPGRQRPARSGVVPAARRLGDGARLAGDAGHGDGLRPARLGVRRLHEGRRVRRGRRR